MRKENVKRLEKYVDRNTDSFAGLGARAKELRNMTNANHGGLESKKWHEKYEKKEFYPHHPAIKSVQRKAKSIALKNKMK